MRPAVMPAVSNWRRRERERGEKDYHGMSVLRITKQGNEIPEVPPGGCWLWIGSRLRPQMLSKGNKRREADT